MIEKANIASRRRRVAGEQSTGIRQVAGRPVISRVEKRDQVGRGEFE